MLAIMALLAWLRGGRWERQGAGVMVVGCLASGLVQDREHMLGPQYGYLIVDIIMFAGFTVVALRSRLWWATWTAGFQLFGVCIHVAMIVDHKVTVYAYYLGIGLYTYLLLIALMTGSLTHKRE